MGFNSGFKGLMISVSRDNVGSDKFFLK